MTEAVGGTGSPTHVGSNRFPCFDGLRAVAALAVLVTHVAFVTGADFRSEFGAFAARLDAGVAVFFVISGFLLYRPFVAARLSGQSFPAVGGYFWRRALRILPAYWLALTITIFVLNVPERTPDPGELFLYYGLLHEYSLDHFVGPILSSYTLVTEIAFYVFLPLYAVVVGARPASPPEHVRRDLVALAGLFAAGVAYRVVVSLADPSGIRDAQLQNILPGWIDAFAAGMALAVVSVWASRGDGPRLPGLDRRFVPAVSWGLAGVAFVVVSVVVGRPSPGIVVYSIGEELAIHYLYIVVAVLLLVPAIFGPQDRGAIRNVLRHLLVLWLGIVSYGLYLWNETLIEKYLQWTDSSAFNTSFLKMLIAVALMTTAIAAVSYYVFERPILRFKRGTRPRRPATASAD
jgi:peptidoglycan/LPS O-acetylase OafA/YrhL